MLCFFSILKQSLVFKFVFFQCPEINRSSFQINHTSLYTGLLADPYCTGLLLLEFASCFFIVVSTPGCAKFPHGSEIWRNADLHRLGCPSEACIPPLPLTQHHPCPCPAADNGEHIIYLVVQAELL